MVKLLPDMNKGMLKAIIVCICVFSWIFIMNIILYLLPFITDYSISFLIWIAWIIYSSIIIFNSSIEIVDKW